MRANCAARGGGPGGTRGGATRTPPEYGSKDWPRAGLRGHWCQAPTGGERGIVAHPLRERAREVMATAEPAALRGEEGKVLCGDHCGPGGDGEAITAPRDIPSRMAGVVKALEYPMKAQAPRGTSQRLN